MNLKDKEKPDQYQDKMQKVKDIYDKKLEPTFKIVSLCW